MTPSQIVIFSINYSKSMVGVLKSETIDPCVLFSVYCWFWMTFFSFGLFLGYDLFWALDTKIACSKNKHAIKIDKDNGP